ncbi:uncharacterized protein LOC134207445 [Armigeres subalbatus]|uniref:uncharacterized protein LOC134207445 n=1 Tax=Armigeres subalbatus TaxID=124917 RepID=UPI002ED18D8F
MAIRLVDPKLHIWYQPSIHRDANGNKVKLGRVAKGCLYDRNNNCLTGNNTVKKLTKTSPLCSVHQENSSVPLGESITEAAVTAYEETKRWFKHHHDEWEAVKKRWTATSAIRLYEIGKQKQSSFQCILEEYPVLRSCDGYQLVKIDFCQKYPAKSDLLFNRFLDFRTRAQVVFCSEASPQCKPLCDFLQENLTDDSRDCITTLLIFYIWPSTFMRLPNGTKWKPSHREVAESSIIFLKSLIDFETELSRLSNQNRKRGLPDYPVIVVVGEGITSVGQFFVCFKDIAYKAETFLKAVDITFKIYTAYGITFPPEATGPWQFIASYLYDFEIPDDCHRARILTLTSTLRNHLTPALAST